MSSFPVSEFVQKLSIEVSLVESSCLLVLIDFLNYQFWTSIIAWNVLKLIPVQISKAGGDVICKSLSA